MSKKNLLECLSIIEDPRLDRRKKHELIDVLVVAVCAVISGAETWIDIEHFGEEREDWFKQFLQLSNGIPSHDTFARVFAILDPKSFETAFYTWIREQCEIKAQVIAIDGKSLNGTAEYAPKRKLPIHMVSAWATESGVVLAQSKARTKNVHELDVMGNLIDMLFLKGSIVTLDAMGSCPRICEKVINQQADYVIALKKNQKLLYFAVEGAFKSAKEKKILITEESGHGRVEKRTYETLVARDHLKEFSKWRGLKTIVKVTSERTTRQTRTQIKDDFKTTKEVRYFITSLSNKIKILSKAIRAHWGIENQLHWKLDVCFREDECRIRIKNSAENFAVLRHIALNLLQKETTQKRSMKSKRLLAGWNTEYLQKIVFNQAI